MLLAPISTDEDERLADLRALRILDTPAEHRFDRIVTLARHVFGVPIAFIAMVDADRQWFKAKCGFDLAQTPRGISFCGHAVLRNEAMVIPDATLDDRFADNPLVIGEPYVRFYAGHPLKGPHGFNVGTLCIIDRQPRDLDSNELAILKQLAAMAEHELNMVEVIDIQRQLLEAKNQLVAAQQKLADELAEAGKYVQSLLPERLTGPITTNYKFISSSQLGGDVLGYHKLDNHQWAIYLLDVTGHGVSAALLSTTLYQTLRAQSLPDVQFDHPAQVLNALNAAIVYPSRLK